MLAAMAGIESLNGYSPILPGPSTAGSIGLYSPSGGTLLAGDR